MFVRGFFVCLLFKTSSVTRGLNDDVEFLDVKVEMEKGVYG